MNVEIFESKERLLPKVLEKVEERLGIQLPAQYRNFLLAMGSIRILKPISTTVRLTIHRSS